MSKARDPPTIKVEDTAADEEDGSTQGADQRSKPTQITEATDSEATVSSLALPNDDGDSLIQPGKPIGEQLPLELSCFISKLEKKVDGGLHGDVYLGTRVKPDKSQEKVAIKCIRRTDGVEEERFNTRVRRETVIWKAADYPNILPFIGHKVVDGVPWLVSPWCQHGNLTAYIASREDITDAEKLKLLCDAARGLAYLHSRQPVIIHGDVKPQNVVVKDNLEAALCDFGLSRLCHGVEKASGLTTSGNKTGGTAGYQAKEVLLGGGSPGPAIDVYAFGGLVLAAMSGKDPFWKRKKEIAKITAIMRDETPSRDDHPDWPYGADTLWALLEDCWKVDPAARPTMKAVLERVMGSYLRVLHKLAMC